ncbi:HTH-type transcriptional repressor NemR [Posidoniimonas corsicana]|uniref:HTH-type transcriptional repressor NemR n=1 Tax=Posidoniimonas corsicana TaxID=1938618 RepID=A0A5C5V0K1_9BACT|nr:TetR/AcrR family transcriptional regulator [Posidoniimonas corsicana]TWT32174.1 HTH-type transcriptional repressor NemR [Posidoniimonas corsicana]
MKEKILEAAESLVQSRGLNAVTFQDLADAVGLRKPSLFHHVKNKEELTLALIDRCSTKHGPRYAAVVERDARAPEKLRAVAKIFEDGLKEGRPCLMAALGGGMDSLSEDAAGELRKAAEGAIGRFEMIFAQGLEEGSLDFEGDAKHAAMTFFAMLQGLQSLCRAKGEPRAFKKAAATFIDSIAVE